MLERFTPYANPASQLPVFQVESRHIPNAHSLPVLLAKTTRRLLVVSVLLVALVFVLSLVTAPAYAWFRHFDSLSQLLFAVALLSVIYLDFYAITLGMHSINGEITKGRWDLLRLTGLRAGNFILAKHQVVQLKVWHKMVMVMALRLASVILLLVSVFFEMRLGGSHLIINLLSFALVLLAGVAFILEPIFRMRAVTALSVMVSASTGGGVTSPLAGIGALFGMWIAQGATSLILLSCASFFLFFLLFIPSASSLGIFLNLLISIAFYKFVQDIALRRAATRLMQAG